MLRVLALVISRVLVDCDRLGWPVSKGHAQAVLRALFRAWRSLVAREIVVASMVQLLVTWLLDMNGLAEGPNRVRIIAPRGSASAYQMSGSAISEP